MTKQKELFYILQDVKFGELSEKEATLKLQELGVVIKVERELPSAPIPCPEPIPNDTYFYRGYERCKQDTLRAGYVAVEPLIEVKK